MRDIGKNIRDIREQKKWTQEDLANQLFVSRQTVSNYETGRTKPDIDMLVNIAAVLETDIHSLIYGPPELLAKKKVVLKLLWPSVCSMVLLLLCAYLSDKAEIMKSTQYIVLPIFLVNIVYKPVLFMVIGWTFMQWVSVFVRLRFPGEKMARVIGISVVGCVLAYLILMGLLVLNFLVPFTLPLGWERAAYFVLGALPGGNNPINYLFVSFIIGALLFVCKQRSNEKRERC